MCIRDRGGGGAIPPAKTPTGEDNPIADITSPSGPTTIIAGQSINFRGSATSGSTPYSYSWNFPGGTPENSTSQNPDGVIFSNAGDYTATLTVTDSDNLSDSDTVEITVIEADAIVPDLEDMERDAAITQLESSGFVPGTIFIQYDDTVGCNRVIQTDPPAGTGISQGTLIHLFISLGQEVPDMVMNHKGVNINYNQPKTPTDSIWEATHNEPFFSDTTWEAQSEYLYNTVPENITYWTGTFTDVWPRIIDQSDSEIRATMTRGLRGTVTQTDPVTHEVTLIGEIVISSVSYAVESGYYEGRWLARASWEILTVNEEIMAGQMYLTCYHVDYYPDVWGRVEGDIHGVYHADSISPSVFTSVEITSMGGGTPESMSRYDIEWASPGSTEEAVYAGEDIYLEEISLQGTGSGVYMSGVLDLSGESMYIPSFNVGSYNGSWYLETPDQSGDMFSFLHLCPQGSVIVPFVEGLSIDGSQYIILESILDLSMEEDFSNTVPVGHVINQTPRAGEEVLDNTRVDLVVSKPTSNWATISAGASHTLAIDQNGCLWAWGDNSSGQLGTGDYIRRPGPVMISADTDWLQVSAGFQHSLAIKDGHIWSWGSNELGQLGRIGQDNIPLRVDEDGQWLAVSAGGWHSLAIMDNDKSLWAWGSNESGQLGRDDIEGGSDTPLLIDNAQLWVFVAAGLSHSLGLANREGNVYAWGCNESGQLGIGDGFQDTFEPTEVNSNWEGWTPVSVAAGGSHSIVLANQGEDYNALFVWGYNEFGQLGLGTGNPDDLDTENRFIPVLAATGNTWSRISAGGNHTLGAKTNGTFWAWGDNTHGQLGNNESGCILDKPVQILSMFGAEAFSAGGSHSTGIKGEGNPMWTWGKNTSGQLGNRTYMNKLEPDRI